MQYLLNMKNCRFLIPVLVAVFATSCSNKAVIHGSLPDAPKSEVIVKLLDINTYKVLDTIKTDKDGNYAYKYNVTKGQPEFLYVFYKDTKIASALLDCGEKVKFTSDTLGGYTVEGSEESALLQQVENDFGKFATEFVNAVNANDNQKMTKLYIGYYRDCIKYIMEHSHSLTVVPVMFQSINEYSPIFSQETDAIHFRAVCDSLKTVYPESRYLKALEDETARRENILQVNERIRQSAESGYPDIVMNDVNGEKKQLSAVRSKAILLHFWTAAEPAHKMFNLDVLMPLYNDFHKKGFEIYSVCLDTNKADWAASVKAQNLPWINVCDGLGLDSPSVLQYNLEDIPASFLLVDGDMTSYSILGEAGLRRELARILK